MPTCAGCKTARGGPALRRCAAAGGSKVGGGAVGSEAPPAPRRARARGLAVRPGARPPRGCFKRALAPTTLPALGRVAVNPPRGGRPERAYRTPPDSYSLSVGINYGLTCVSTFETSAPLYFIFGTLSRRNRSKIQVDPTRSRITKQCGARERSKSRSRRLEIPTKPGATWPRHLIEPTAALAAPARALLREGAALACGPLGGSEWPSACTCRRPHGAPRAA